MQKRKVERRKETRGDSTDITLQGSGSPHALTIGKRIAERIKYRCDAWNSFWFNDRAHQDIAWVRTSLALACSIYALSWILTLKDWISENSLLNRVQVEFLIGRGVAGTGSEGRISPLFSLISPDFAWSYALATALLTGLVAIGVGGRVIVVLAWLTLLGIVHRVPMIQGAGDFLMTGLFGYLVIFPGRISWQVPSTITANDGRSGWLCNLAFRLIQCHVFLWFAISLASHLFEPMWWTADAPWWLSFSGERSWVSMQFWIDFPYWMNAISYWIIILHIAILLALVNQSIRFLGLFAMIALAFTVLIIANDWVYSLAIVSCSTIFVPAPPMQRFGTGVTTSIQSLNKSLRTN